MTDARLDTGDLLLQAARRLRRAWGEALVPWQVSPHEARALRVVVRGPLRPTDLAARLRVTARSVTEVADSLEAKGLLERAPSPTDRRATLLVATAAAERVAAEMAAVRGAATERLLGGLDAAERKALHALLERLLQDDPAT